MNRILKSQKLNCLKLESFYSSVLPDLVCVLLFLPHSQTSSVESDFILSTSVVCFQNWLGQHNLMAGCPVEHGGIDGSLRWWSPLQKRSQHERFLFQTFRIVEVQRRIFTLSNSASSTKQGQVSISSTFFARVFRTNVFLAAFL